METLFLLEARFCQINNLKLAYILNVCKNASLGEASKVLKISRNIVSRILEDNPAFDSKMCSIRKKGGGGRERRIKLSGPALLYIETIVELAELRFGVDECSRLRREASKISKGVIKMEAKYTDRIKSIQRIYREGRDSDSKRLIQILSRETGKSVKEITMEVVR